MTKRPNEAPNSPNGVVSLIQATQKVRLFPLKKLMVSAENGLRYQGDVQMCPSASAGAKAAGGRLLSTSLTGHQIGCFHHALYFFG
jgi:hypothetical protein